MKQAHKYPCGDKTCPQTFCISDRIRQDQNMENCKEIDKLRTLVESQAATIEKIRRLAKVVYNEPDYLLTLSDEVLLFPPSVEPEKAGEKS